MKYLSPEEYAQTIDKRNKIRYYSIILFCLSVLLAIAFTFISPFNDTSTLAIVMIWFLASFVIFFYILIKPYFDQVYPERAETDSLNPTHVEYHEEVKFKLLQYIIIPILTFNVIAIPFIVPTGVWPTIIAAFTAIFLLIIFLVFGHIRIHYDGQTLRVRFGPLKDKFAISDITRIENIQVRAIKDYLGYGKRLGPDGSIGYIVRGGKAIRLVMNNSKIYVISSNDPDKLISMLKSGK